MSLGLAWKVLVKWLKMHDINPSLTRRLWWKVPARLRRAVENVFVLKRGRLVTRGVIFGIWWISLWSLWDARRLDLITRTWVPINNSDWRAVCVICRLCNDKTPSRYSFDASVRQHNGGLLSRKGHRAMHRCITLSGHDDPNIWKGQLNPQCCTQKMNCDLASNNHVFQELRVSAYWLWWNKQVLYEGIMSIWCQL